MQLASSLRNEFGHLGGGSRGALSLFVIRHDPHTDRYVVQRGYSRNRDTIVETIGEYATREEAVAQVHRLRDLEHDSPLPAPGPRPD